MIKYEFISEIVDILIAIILVIVSIPIWLGFQERMNENPVIEENNFLVQSYE